MTACCIRTCLAPRDTDHTCDTTEGSSGSPMWDAAGNLRAVHVVSYRSKELNAATPLRKEVGASGSGVGVAGEVESVLFALLC